MIKERKTLMQEVHEFEVECLRRQLALREEEIKRLHELLDLYDRERYEQEKAEN